MKTTLEWIFPTLLGLLLGACASTTTAARRTPGDPDTKSTKLIEQKARERREQKVAALEDDFLQIERELADARRRAIRQAERSRVRAELARVEARLREAKQDFRDLKVASDGSFERLEVRLDTSLPNLRASFRNL